MQSNMLTVKKIKLHGMTNDRWNTTDKILQYKGLAALYARDKKVLEKDTSVARKKLKKQIKNLRKEIVEQRAALDNSIRGNKQRLRNTLAENRNLQLAYQNTTPIKVIDILYQQNFNRRKELDRLKYHMKSKTDKLIALKLEFADLEDRIKYEVIEKIPEEEQAQIITAKVEDAVLKSETAMEVRNTYNRILWVLKKDSIYFDAVLTALYIDGNQQGKCILKVTEMGQLGTEYLDDKRKEYGTLEKMLRQMQKEQTTTMKTMQHKIEQLHSNVKYLIRRYSGTELDEEKRGRPSNDLEKSIEDIKLVLNKITELASCAKIEDICPKVGAQMQQKERLNELVLKHVERRNILLNKLRHAEEMYSNISHKMVESTMWYKEEKTKLLAEIGEKEEAKRQTMVLVQSRGELVLKVRSALQQMSEQLRNVNVAPPKDAFKTSIRERTTYGEIAPTIKPEAVEVNANLLIKNITKKVQLLVSAAVDIKETKDVVDNLKCINDMIVPPFLIDTAKKAEGFMDEFVIEDPHVPSRAEIKRVSDEICKKFSKANEFDMPVVAGLKTK